MERHRRARRWRWRSHNAVVMRADRRWWRRTGGWARVRTFVPILTERYARQLIERAPVPRGGAIREGTCGAPGRLCRSPSSPTGRLYDAAAEMSLLLAATLVVFVVGHLTRARVAERKAVSDPARYSQVAARRIRR